MAKWAVRGGHTEKATGANGLINELTEDRKIKDAVIKYLKLSGETVLDCTPPANANLNAKTDLAYGVNKANEWGADYFISCHFNNAYNSYDGAIGTEVCVYNTYDMAQRVVNKIASLGFINRGQKVRTGLYELKNTAMKAMIIETCFVEATKDVALYKSVGSDTIGKIIVEGLLNKTVNLEKPKQDIYRVLVDGTHVGSYSVTSNILNQVKKAVASGCSEIKITKV